MVIVACVGLFGSGLAAFLLGVAAIVLHALSLLKTSWVLLKIAERLENPLPEGIVTFGDLARRLAGAESASMSV